MAKARQVSLVALGIVSFAVGSFAVGPVHAQQDAKQIVQLAANAELAANREDNSHWRYIDRHKEDDGATNVFVVVETEHGAIKRHLEENGKPASAATIQADYDYNQRFIHDPSLQAKQKRDGMHDEKSAEQLTAMMPTAFLWTIVSETPETYTLSYKPNPDFRPPNIEAHVMGTMAGTLIVNKAGYRIRTFKGSLSDDVYIGYGFLGKLRKGGTFDIERSQIAPGLWQITETHVHISGRALFFKSIGQQDDEMKSHFTPVPPSTTLEQAVALLDEPRQP
jgi:hypothetical protein